MTVKPIRIAASISLTAVLGFSTVFAAVPANAVTANTGQDTNATTTAAPNSVNSTTTPQIQQSPNNTAIQPGSDSTSPTDTDSTSTTNNVGPSAVPTQNSANPSPTVAAPTANTPTNSNATSNSQANVAITQDAVLAFAQKAAIASFSYDYSNYQQDMSNMQQYFSKTGWESFSKALAASNNLNVVQKEKLTVSAILNGQVTVTQQQQTATGQEWQVEVPVQVTYKNDKNQQIQQDLKVKMIIQTVSTDVNPQGIGINQFIAMPATKATIVNTPSQ